MSQDNLQDGDSAWCICMPRRVTTQEFVGVSQSETGEEHYAEVVLDNKILKKVAGGGKGISEAVREPTDASGLCFEEIPFNLGDRVAVWSAGRQVWYEDGVVKDVGPCGVQVLYNSGSFKKTVPHVSTDELLRVPAQPRPASDSHKELSPPACGESDLGDWQHGVCESLAVTPHWKDTSGKSRDSSADYALYVRTCVRTCTSADAADDPARSTRTIAANEFRLSFTIRGPKDSPYASTSAFNGVSQLQLSEAATAATAPLPTPPAGQGFVFVAPFQCDGKPSLVLGGLIGRSDTRFPSCNISELHILDAGTGELLRSFRCDGADGSGGAAGCGCTIA